MVRLTDLLTMVTAVEAETLNHKSNKNRQYCDQVSRIYNFFYALLN